MAPLRLFYRHPLWIRVTHWLNAICMAVLLMSGLQIFNAHPALYWGQKSDFDHPSVEDAQGNESGVTTVRRTQLQHDGRTWPFEGWRSRFPRLGDVAA